MPRTTHSHIEARSEKCGGKPCIAGTRIRVHDIYAWHVLGGESPLEMLAAHPELSLASIHAAFSYVFDHREEIEADVAAENAAYEQLKRNSPSKVQAKLNATDGTCPLSS